MEPETIRTLNLDNGITLSLLDASRKIAGDRWFVCMITRMVIPVRQETLGHKNNFDLDEIRNLVGEQVVFEHKQERNFISMDEKEMLSGKMASSFSALAESYYSRPEFAGRYIMKQFYELKKRQSWYK